MWKRYNILKKYRHIEVVVVVLMCLFLIAVIPVVFRKLRFEASRARCAQNLGVLGKAMMEYANEHDGKFPRSGGRNSNYGSSIPDWRGTNRIEAFALKPDGSGGGTNITSCFYLLVKHADVSPEFFVCSGDSGTTEFKLSDADVGDKKLVDLWDFGRFAFKHCSYSYHMPFSQYPLTMECEPGMAVAADRNPWIKFPAARGKKFPGKFSPDGDREAIKAGNSISHQEEGQNVLFLDNHVDFEKSSLCGINNDNIYTVWASDTDRRMGVLTWPGIPVDKTDSNLIHDIPSVSDSEHPPTRGPRGQVLR